MEIKFDVSNREKKLFLEKNIPTLVDGVGFRSLNEFIKLFLIKKK